MDTARMLNTLYTLKKPTIACIRGAVRGGGCGLVAACDIAIAARTATFRLSEVKLGIIPAMISPYVIAAMGARMSRRYMLSGEEFDSAEAYRIGFIHDIVEDDDLNARVGIMLAHLYTSGPQAVLAIKELIPVSADAPIGEEIIEETSRRIARIRATPEAQEGLSAFLEKRKPSWVEPRSKAKKPVKTSLKR
jgi:methylglutaconyl-CoA hydratase